MGRNTLSTKALAQKLIADLKPLSEMLPPNERRVVEKFCETIDQQRVAISEATDLLPLEAALIVLLVEERRRNDAENIRVYEALHEQIVELRAELAALSHLLPSAISTERIG
jgi:hypothetical protein